MMYAKGSLQRRDPFSLRGILAPNLAPCALTLTYEVRSAVRRGNLGYQDSSQANCHCGLGSTIFALFALTTFYRHVSALLKLRGLIRRSNDALARNNFFETMRRPPWHTRTGEQRSKEVFGNPHHRIHKP